MGRVIRGIYHHLYIFHINYVHLAQRKGSQPMFKALTHKRVAPAKFRNLDYS